MLVIALIGVTLSIAALLGFLIGTALGYARAQHAADAGALTSAEFSRAQRAAANFSAAQVCQFARNAVQENGAVLATCMAYSNGRVELRVALAGFSASAVAEPAW